MYTLIINKIYNYIPMWGVKQKQSKQSEFFKGASIFEKLINSTFGKIKQTISEIFSPEDIETYTLPKVIVIGNESTGKSSLLENITKCQLFPRDSKLCTKCPIHVKLTNGPSKYVISYPQDSKDVKSSIKTIEVKNKYEIYDIIQKYMMGFPSDYISETEITVDITDVGVPTFEFYDLPGIRTYPLDAAETTMKLCRKYLRDKNSIVLCVVPATTTRLTSCQSIALISEMKMGHNCILALTMVDRLQQENIEDLLIKRIIQTSDELDDLNFAGCIAVVNRLHSDLHSLEENDKNEIEWFNNNILQYIPSEYIGSKQLIEDNITVTNLVSKMDDLYNKFIHEDWKPRILKSITEKKLALNLKYIDLGEEKIDSKQLNELITGNTRVIINSYVFFLLTEEEEKVEDKKANSIKQYQYETSEKKYHSCLKLIDEKITEYQSVIFSYIYKRINDYFAKEEKFKIKRFGKVKDNLVNLLKQTFDELVQKNIKNIEFCIKDYLLRQYLDNDHIDYSVIYLKLFRLYKLLVFYPLSMIEINYEENDYVESDEYIQKRSNLLNSINKIQKHYELIVELS